MLHLCIVRWRTTYKIHQSHVTKHDLRHAVTNSAVEYEATHYSNVTKPAGTIIPVVSCWHSEIQSRYLQATSRLTTDGAVRAALLEGLFIPYELLHNCKLTSTINRRNKSHHHKLQLPSVILWSFWGRHEINRTSSKLYQSFKAPWLLYVLPNLLSKYPAFCPHSVLY